MMKNNINPARFNPDYKINYSQRRRAERNARSKPLGHITSIEMKNVRRSFNTQKIYAFTLPMIVATR